MLREVDIGGIPKPKGENLPDGEAYALLNSYEEWKRRIAYAEVARDAFEKVLSYYSTRYSQAALGRALGTTKQAVSKILRAGR